MDTDDSRARNLIMNGTRHSSVEVRRSCIEMLPMLLVEDKLRIVATELLQSETNAELKKMLLRLRKEQFGLRMQDASGQLGQYHLLSQVKRDIARVKTMK